jgi:cell division protein FtsB
VNVRRIILSLYLLLFVGIIVTSAAFFLQTREEYQRLKGLEARSQKRIVELETKLKAQQQILDRLQNDPAYVERVIRKQLRYAKPDEYIFRFERDQ